MHSIWQNSTANAYLVHFWKKKTNSNVAHIYWLPGIVNTNTVRSQSYIVRLLSKMMGMIEPEEAGETLANRIDDNKSADLVGKFFNKGRIEKTKNKIKNDEENFDKLMLFSEQFTKIKFKDFIV